MFDGTSRRGEVLAVVVRFISDWNIEQRLVQLEFLQKSLNGEELARQLLVTHSVVLGIVIVLYYYGYWLHVVCTRHRLKVHFFFTPWILKLKHFGRREQAKPCQHTLVELLGGTTSASTTIRRCAAFFVAT